MRTRIQKYLFLNVKSKKKKKLHSEKRMLKYGHFKSVNIWTSHPCLLSVLAYLYDHLCHLPTNSHNSQLIFEKNTYILKSHNTTCYSRFSVLHIHSFLSVAVDCGLGVVYVFLSAWHKSAHLSAAHQTTEAVVMPMAPTVPEPSKQKPTVCQSPENSTCKEQKVLLHMLAHHTVLTESLVYTAVSSSSSH